ncbi:NADP-binding protein [Gigaspora margarita]|uniref:NADP-binding protein n=1 Tax=Gigaspora margarita TaxID=4874 RepID=A0A8H4AXN0_GIGMA|nr:NADP-binding protein [Gigaspora margarita]
MNLFSEMGAEQSTIKSYDLSNKVVIITGSTDGIGKSLARIISSYNPKRLVLPVRNREKGEKLFEYIRNSQDGKVECAELWDIDFADLHSVKSFADKFVKEVGELHYLWNNAGIFNFNNSATSESPCKINFTGSDNENFGNIDLDDLTGEKSSGSFKFQANSKLMDHVYSNELNRRLQGSNVISLICLPGFVSTNAGDLPQYLLPLKRFAMAFGSSPDIGAINVMYPVLDATIDDGGKSFRKCEEMKVSGQATDEEFAKKFWEKCELLLRNFDPNLLE